MRIKLLFLLLFCAILGVLAIPTAEAGRTKNVLAFYYGWYDPSAFGAGKTPYQPLYPYYSTSRSTIQRQVRMARSAGIDGFVMSWYGPDASQQTEPNFATLLDVAQESGFKASVHFETFSPWFKSNGDRIYALQELMKRHAYHPSYLKLDGKPVVFFWANWALSVDEWKQIRAQADPYNNAYWIAEGGHTEYLEVFDGLHLYNVAWSANPASINAIWADKTRNYGGNKLWAGTAMPGFDNSMVPGQGDITVRGRGSGNYLRSSFRGAAATSPDYLLLTSFNEWAEGSGIEPSQEFGTAYLEAVRGLSAEYKGLSASAFPPIPYWPAPPTPTPLATIPPTIPPTTPPTAIPTSVPTATPEKIAAISQRTSQQVSEPTAVPIIPTNTPIAIAQAEQTPGFAPEATPNPEGTYTVRVGDTLTYIADQFEMTVFELQRLNNLSDSDFIRVGQILRVADRGGVSQPNEPAVSAPPTTASTTATTATPAVSASSAKPTVPSEFGNAILREDGAYVHVVEDGDSLITIALKYGYRTMDDFFEVNGLSLDSVIFLGDEIVVGQRPVPLEVGGSSDEATDTPVPEPTATPLNNVTPAATFTPVPQVTVVSPTEAVAEIVEPVVSEQEGESALTIQLTIQPTPVRVEQPSVSRLNTPALIGFVGSALMVLAAIGYVLFGRRE